MAITISGRVLGAIPYNTGTIVATPVSFGNQVNWTPSPAHFGNVDIENLGNQVQWTPSPAQFGNKMPGGAVTVTLSGAGVGTTSTDEFGNFSFTGLAAGQYTVTPTQAGLTFAPASRTFTVADSVNAINFAVQ